MGGASSQEIAGIRIFKVHAASPAADAGLEVFFDVILEVNGAQLVSGNQQSFASKIKESENTVAKLTVYNCRDNATRQVSITPKAWSGSGLLGATVRYDTVDLASCHGIRVLEVFPNSPAAHAGLVPFQDYLLGTGTTAFTDVEALIEAVDASLNQVACIHTYNSESETVREVSLKPNRDWGGDGCIGCDIGTGLLHKIPPPRRPVGGADSGASSATSSAFAAVDAAQVKAAAHSPVFPSRACRPAAPSTATEAGPNATGASIQQATPGAPLEKPESMAVKIAALDPGNAVEQSRSSVGKIAKQWPPPKAAIGFDEAPAAPVVNSEAAPPGEGPVI
jgi:hypothetical protein